MGYRVLITGSSGRLGDAVVSVLRKDGWDVLAPRRGTGHDPRSLDVTDADSCRRLLQSEPVDVVIHLAAICDPDICERHPDYARAVNVFGTKNLLEAMGTSRFVFVSTDAVFNGRSPPYREDSAREPLNVYGRTKMEAEDLVLDRTTSPLVVRLPLLYTSNLREPRNPLASIYTAIVRNNPQDMDDWQVRYPCLTEDVASVLAVLLRQRTTGIMHLSASEGLTRYRIAERMAEHLQILTTHLRRCPQPNMNRAPRPRDARLDTTRMAQTLGGTQVRAFSDVLPTLVRGHGARPGAEQ